MRYEYYYDNEHLTGWYPIDESRIIGDIDKLVEQGVLRKSNMNKLLKIKSKTEYFYDTKTPERGIYFKIELEDNTIIWANSNLKEIINADIIRELNKNL